MTKLYVRSTILACSLLACIGALVPFSGRGAPTTSRQSPEWAVRLGLFAESAEERQAAWTILNFAMAGMGQSDPPLRVRDTELTPQLLDDYRTTFTESSASDRIETLRKGLEDKQQISMNALAIIGTTAATEANDPNWKPVFDGLVGTVERLVNGDSPEVRYHAQHVLRHIRPARTTLPNQ